MYGLELGRSARRTGAGAYRGGHPSTACYYILSPFIKHTCGEIFTEFVHRHCFHILFILELDFDALYLLIK